MTGSRPNTWMPLYIPDYLADTRSLTAAQHGAYLLLIMQYWTSGAPLNDDDGELSRIAAMTAKEWTGARRVLARFFQIDSGRWVHKRIEGEIAKATANVEARQRAGKAGGLAKAKGWQNPSNATSQPVANGRQNPTPLPSPSPVSKSSEAYASGAGAPVVEDLELPLGLVRPPGGDWSVALFRQGLAWLASKADKPPAKLRPFLGEALKACGQDHRRVFELIAEAERTGVAEPQAWLMKTLGKSGSGFDVAAALVAGARGEIHEG